MQTRSRRTQPKAKVPKEEENKPEPQPEPQLEPQSEPELELEPKVKTKSKPAAKPRPTKAQKSNGQVSARLIKASATRKDKAKTPTPTPESDLEAEVESKPEPQYKPESVAELEPELSPQPAQDAKPELAESASEPLNQEVDPDMTEEIGDNSIDFSDFKAEKVIDDSIDHKILTFQGKYKGQIAVCRLEKMPFDSTAVKKALNDNQLTAKPHFINDIYHSYMLQMSGSLNDLKTTFVWPATPAILNKYSRTEKIFVAETPEVYNKIVEPYIDRVIKSKDDPNRWVFNILEGKSEVENVIFNDPDPDSGFMLTRSIKSSGSDDDLYMLAICHRRDIRSIRDLNDTHLVLLKNILTKGTKVIKDKFKKHKGSLRLFVHYQPTFYHFHVHIKAVDPSSYIASDRDHLLNTIISNLMLNSDYYKKATITHPLAVGCSLYNELKKAKKV